jgi:membrane protein YqaA with SNARE-associated domain
MTAYVLNHKGEEVISERHQKDFKKEYNTEKVTQKKLYQIYLVLQILILMTFNLYS